MGIAEIERFAVVARAKGFIAGKHLTIAEERAQLQPCDFLVAPVLKVPS